MKPIWYKIGSWTINLEKVEAISDIRYTHADKEFLENDKNNKLFVIYLSNNFINVFEVDLVKLTKIHRDLMETIKSFGI